MNATGISADTFMYVLFFQFLPEHQGNIFLKTIGPISQFNLGNIREYIAQYMYSMLDYLNFSTSSSSMFVTEGCSR